MDFFEWAESSLTVSEQVDEWMVKLADICDKKKLTGDEISLATGIIHAMAKQDEKIHELKYAASYLAKRNEDIRKRYEEVTAQRIRSQLSIKRLNEAIDRMTVQEEAKRTTTGVETKNRSSVENLCTLNITTTPLREEDRSRFREKKRARRSVSAATIRHVKNFAQRFRSASRNRL